MADGEGAVAVGIVPVFFVFDRVEDSGLVPEGELPPAVRPLADAGAG